MKQNHKFSLYIEDMGTILHGLNKLIKKYKKNADFKVDLDIILTKSISHGELCFEIFYEDKTLIGGFFSELNSFFERFNIKPNLDLKLENNHDENNEYDDLSEHHTETKIVFAIILPDYNLKEKKKIIKNNLAPFDADIDISIHKLDDSLIDSLL
ncbi:MAG: hypothetical protein PF689_06670 [Deltaproteobacteria bacterium]|jgi:hypothetical protein|nr:hypothetical protein [Deltaproteobacteria bacterium]